LFKLLSTKKSARFGIDLATALIDHVPLRIATEDTSKASSKSNYAKEKLQKRIRQFKQEEVLNFFKTARLLNSFKWTLKDAGYADDFIEKFASWLLVALRNPNF
jgi:tetratricopeptide (TPR) repeat protein